ncbi:MAG: type II secretion system minor pseudopilin GspJ [Gallionella sp.]|jgi:general secretion pathway protein J|nr:type II secretion system minor pseudopilin GspJ [Gallionella sp.]
MICSWRDPDIRNGLAGSKPSSCAGFTLIELLVALLILALLSVAGFRGLNAVIEARDRVSAETRLWQHLEIFFAQMEQNISQAIPRRARNAEGLTQPEWIGHTVVSTEDDAELTFTRAGIEGDSTTLLAPQRIAYRFENNAIVMLRWPTPDAGERVRPFRYPLIEGVKSFSLRHMDANRNWLNQWPPSQTQEGLPRALEVTLVLVDNKKIVRVFAL